MANPNAIVSPVVRFEPPLDRPATELLRTTQGLSVEFTEGRRVRLDPANSRSAGFAQVLEGARRLGTPVYLETDPATSVITRLLIPLVARVVALRPGATGSVEVELMPSHARHILRRDQPDFGQFQELLNDASRSGQPLIVTDDEGHDIIDVRPFRPGPDDGPLPPLPPWPPVPLQPNWLLEWLRRLWRWPWWPWWWFGCISATHAQQIFDAMNATTCDPLTVPSPCIPFLFPDDGCWARAHEMCRLMIQTGLSPKKVWIESQYPNRLHVNTRNNPACFVEWGWHVAPTLCVRGRFPFWAHTMVIDPSLFTTPVTKANWKGVQNDPTATLTDTAASIYWLWGNVTDPTYSQTNHYLAVYRLALQTRSLQQGPPPYANCP